jgi:FtsP/CotA-like multicopper oxidase with cupredoxin domain
VGTVELWATDGYISTPDGNSIYIWGFSGSPDSGAQLPGPLLVAGEGETLTVNLTNRLSEPVSARFPGQEGIEVLDPATGLWEPARPQFSGGDLVSLVQAVPPGETRSYRFVAAHPGTYLYESGTEAHKQVPMGLHGALVVRPADYDPVSNRTAYGAGTETAFDREYLLVLLEIDPDLHLAVQRRQPYRIGAYKPRYWTMNGRCSPDTMLMDGVPQLSSQPYGAMIQAEPGETVLLRYVGAGVDNHPLHPHGNHTRLIGLDGRLLQNGAADLSFKRFTVLVGQGQTYDMLYQWTGLGYTPSNPIPTSIPNLRNLKTGGEGITMWSGSAYLGYKSDLPVGIVSFNEVGEYHFMLHSHEEPQITNWSEFPGGLMTMIAIYPPGTLGPDVGVLRTDL